VADGKVAVHRFDFEVTNLKPFPYLPFPHFSAPESTQKQASFDGELMRPAIGQCDILEDNVVRRVHGQSPA
jgi:hypothetical protein